MKRSVLKELIKRSMQEVTPNTGAMTPEEEKMVADYETEEEPNKHALDNERPMEEASSKSAEILNRPAGRMTFEQMGMIMMLADAVGENKEADEFFSRVASKKEAEQYIQSLITKVDGEEGVLAEAEKIVAAWAEKQTIKEEMIGGYIDLLGPDFEDGVKMVEKAWNVWKAGELTEPGMIDHARQDIMTHIKNTLI